MRNPPLRSKIAVNSQKPTSSGDSQKTSTKHPAAKQDVLDQIKKEVGRGTQNATPIPSPKDTYNKDEKPTISNGDSQNTSAKQPAAKQDMLDQIKKEVGRGTQNATPIPSPKDTIHLLSNQLRSKICWIKLRRKWEGDAECNPNTFTKDTYNKDEKPTITSGDSQNTSAKQPAAKQDMLDQIKKEVGRGTQNATPIPSPKDTCNQDEKPTITSGDSQNTSTKQPAAKQDVLDQIKKEAESGTQNASPTTFKQTTEISASLPIQIKICNIHETNASRDVTKASRPYICGRCLNDQKRGELLDLRIATAKADQIANKKLNKLKIRALELEIENKELDLQMKKTSLSTPANQNVDQIKKKVGSGTQNATPIPSPKDTFNQDEKPTITSDDSQNTSTNQAAAKQDMLDQSNKEVGSGTQNATPIPSPKDTFNQDEKPTITSDDSQNTSTKQPAAKEYVADQIKKEVKSGTQNRPQPLFKNRYNQDVTPTISSVDYNADSPKISAPETHAFEDVTKASRPYICGRCLNDQKRGELLDLRIATANADQIANEKLNKLKIRALELEIENKELDLQMKKKPLST
ncbi:nucleolar protein dao-5-like [Atheta coriaria]|uniref:nucleolar protein dao-5-like n=1 Tax=Dalotia coriaria TaxID=877792 RepID=UPI0031F409BE